MGIRVNGRWRQFHVEPRRTLLTALRVDLGLTGAKPGCEQGNCGACTVHLNGRAVYSCLVPAVACDGADVLTVEGLGSAERLDPIQQSFVDHDAFQCGYCTPGQIMAVKALLDQNPAPTADDVRQALAGNLCRCGAYQRIVEAALAAAGGARATAGGER